MHGLDGLRLVYPVNFNDWCNAYDLEVFSGRCSKCGTILPVNQAFEADKHGKSVIRGLTANPCHCGNHEVPFEFVDLSEDTQRAIGRMFNDFNQK